MRRSFVLAAIGLALAVGACRRAPEVPPAAVDHAAEARKAIAAQQWAVAAGHLRTALQQDPKSLFLHHNLAICATWLDLKDEAIHEFEWVMAHAPADSEEAKTARRWLAANKDRRPTQAAPEPAAVDPTVGNSGVHGVVTWGQQPQARLQLFLRGLRGTTTKDLQYMLRSDREGRYGFKNVVPGPYMLTDAVAGSPKWRLRVEAKPGEDLALDLTPENAASVRDDF